jgi:hypothetical protein
MTLFVVCFLLCVICLAVVDAVATTPAGEISEQDWQLPIDDLRDNGLRGEVILNGFWAGRAQGESGAFTRVCVPDAGGSRENYEYYRDFTLPAGWEARQLVLNFSRLQPDALVTLDGVPVPVHAGEQRFADVPLQLATRAGATHRLRILTGVIEGDIWLRSSPKSTDVIDDSYIMTSYRNMTLTLRLAGTGKPGARLHPMASIYADAAETQLVKTISAETMVIVGADGRWKTEIFAPWPDARLWSRWHPHLYYYTAEVCSTAGKVCDRVLPRRFGFREVWIEQGRFVVNGIPFSGTDDTWHPGTNLMREEMEAIFANAKRMGLSMGFRTSSDMMLDVADAQGMLLEVDAGSLVRINIWDPTSGLTKMSGQEDTRDIETCIRRWREHPSVLLWYSAAPFSHNTLYAGHVGQPYHPWDFFPGNRDAARAQEAHAVFRDTGTLITSLDPTRPVVTANSPSSDVERVTRYLCDNLDLQEEEEFFDYWFRSGSDKAIWVAEFGVPFQGHNFIREIDHQMDHVAPWPAIYVERAARQFGDEVYRALPDDTLTRWPRMWVTDHRVTPVYQRLYAEAIYRTWRAWRTYGVSASGHYIARDGFAMQTGVSAQQRYGVTDAADPRRPGLSRAVDAHDFPMLEVDPILPAGEAYLHGISPLLAYIGGADTHFTAKDHLYYAGADVRKAAIVINDYDDPAELTGAWQLLAANGHVVTAGDINGTVHAGCRALVDFPIDFTAPEVRERTEYLLTLRLRANLSGMLEDQFPITVFPRRQATSLQFAGNIWRLNISDDRTHETQHFFINRDNDAFLEAAGVSSQLVQGLKTFTWQGCSPEATADIDKGRQRVTEGIPQPGDLLLIPRHCLQAGQDDRQLNLRLLEEQGLDALVEQGLRVIVFEQNLPNLFGINTEDVRPRRAFMAAPGHPVFTGLQASDLTDWSGESTLDIAMSPVSMSERQLPERVWHVSNTNAVASKTLIRPQVGATRALAVSGFDLQESPLLEVTRGKGRILFCQFDVTNRYGIDPAATRLVDNILLYMTTVPEPDPAKSTVEFLPVDDVHVVARHELFRAAKPAGQDGWGITNGELFFRESIYANNQVTATLPDVTVPVLAASATEPLPRVIRRNPASGQLALTLRESLFTTGWAKRKVAWLRGTLLVNQGGSSLSGPALRLHGKLTDLYPIVWVDHFVHPYTADLW